VLADSPPPPPLPKQMTVTNVNTGTTPMVIGVNLGHHHPSDGSWVAFLEHLGVNGAFVCSARAPPRV
jgi:hypothetical protein